MSKTRAAIDVFTSVPLRMVSFFRRAGKAATFALALVLIGLTALADWLAGTDVSLGVLYIVPLIIAASVFSPSVIIALSGICAVLGLFFYHPRPILQTALHFFFALIANLAAGLFMVALVRHREAALEHIRDMKREQNLRRATEEELRVLADSSPATILTLDERGVVLAGNHAANKLFGIPPDESILDRPIQDYLPVLTDALRVARNKEVFQSTAQSRGKRHNGEMFLAHTWFSIYELPEGTRLSAIIVDGSEEMRDREEIQLQLASITNRITATAMSHEIRNFCRAMSMLYSPLAESPKFSADRRFRELGNLIDGLESIASSELESSIPQFLEHVHLKQVLDDLRIVIEPAWREVNGTVHWDLPRNMPIVLGQRHGLLQALLNLSQNSRSAVAELAHRQLTIRVEESKGRVFIVFCDSGPGIPEPERLFQPFQPGANSAGMGLYVSRAILRNYGGELRHVPSQEGACFEVELEAGSEVR